MVGRLAESVAILIFTPILAAAYYFGIRVRLTRSPSVRGWSQRPLGASLLLLAAGLAVYSLYETKPKGTPLREWITSNPYLTVYAVLALLILALLLLSWFAVVLLALANVAWVGIRLLGPPVRHLRREQPSCPLSEMNRS